MPDLGPEFGKVISLNVGEVIPVSAVVLYSIKNDGGKGFLADPVRIDGDLSYIGTGSLLGTGVDGIVRQFDGGLFSKAGKQLFYPGSSIADSDGTQYRFS